MPKIKEQVVTIDARGFLRFVATSATELLAKQLCFVDIFVDRTGKRIGLKMAKKERPGSFRLLDHGGRALVFIKGAFSEAKMVAKPGHYPYTQSEGMTIISGKSTKTGAWEFFPCRNSASIPMASLDARGTLILDRNCTSALEIPAFDTASSEFDAKKKELTLTVLKKKGDLNIRAVGSHANISLMGTLSSFGIPLPKKSVRLVCTLKGQTVKVSLADLANPTR